MINQKIIKINSLEYELFRSLLSLKFETGVILDFFIRHNRYFNIINFRRFIDNVPLSYPINKIIYERSLDDLHYTYTKCLSFLIDNRIQLVKNILENKDIFYNIETKL